MDSPLSENLLFYSTQLLKIMNFQMRNNIIEHSYFYWILTANFWMCAGFFKSVGGEIVAKTEKLGDKPNPEDLIGLTKIVLDLHKNNEVDEVYLCSNKFVNTMTQQPDVQQLIPLPSMEQDEKVKQYWDYIYEPEAEILLEGLLTRYIESLIYQAVVENVACEQAAKMLAMKNATDNAGDLIKELELLYNNVRQAAITQELSEIVGGAAAV